MALSPTAIWHDWSTGAAANGGVFNPANANFINDLTTDANTANTANPVVSSASYTFVNADIGYHVFIQGGTNWTPQWALITAVNAGKATIACGIGSSVLYGTSATAANYQRPNGLNTVAGCATVGTPTGGIWGVDYSQNATARYAFNDMVCGTTGAGQLTFTSSANPVGKNMVGNGLNVVSGSGWTVQRAEISSVSLAGTPTATCVVPASGSGTLATGSSTGGTANLGGALGTSSTITAIALSGLTTGSPVAGNKVFLKGSRTLTATTTVLASQKGDVTNGRIVVEGFTTFPGALDGRTVITSATNSVALITCNANDYFDWIHLKLTHTAATRAAGFIFNTANSVKLRFIDCLFDGCSQAIVGGTASGGGLVERCEVKNCTATAVSSISLAGAAYVKNYIHDNAGDGISFSFAVTDVIGNIITTNGRYGILDNTGSGGAINAYQIVGNTIASNVNDGIRMTGDVSPTSSAVNISRNILYNNGTGGTGYGVNWTNCSAGEMSAMMLVNEFNAYGANATGTRNNMMPGFGDVALTGSPFVNTGTGDWSLDATAGEGAACRNVGFTFAGGTMTTYDDIGALEHLDAGGSGGASPTVRYIGLEGVAAF